DEHRHRDPELLAVEHRAVARDHAVLFERPHAAQAWRGGEVQALGERGVGDPPLRLQHGKHLPVHGVHGADHCAPGGSECRKGHDMPPDRRDHVSMLSTRSATALYVGAVLGPGVLILPSLAAEAAGPASVLAWAGLLALSVPLAIAFAVL